MSRKATSPQGRRPTLPHACLGHQHGNAQPCAHVGELCSNGLWVKTICQPCSYCPNPRSNNKTQQVPVPVRAQVANLLNEETPQIYAACGRGSRSTLRVLRPGLAVTELAVWPLPGAPTAVWTLKRSQQDELDAYIVVSFDNATLVCDGCRALVNMRLCHDRSMCCMACSRHTCFARSCLCACPPTLCALFKIAERMDVWQSCLSRLLMLVPSCRCCPSARRWRR